MSDGVDFVAIEKALAGFVKATLGVECFFGDDAVGGQPPLPYVMINWMTAPSSIGSDEDLADADSVDTTDKTRAPTRSGPRVATLSVHFFSDKSDPTTRKTAMQMASKFEAEIDSDRARELYLNEGGIGLGDMSDIRNIPSPRDGTRKRVQHAQMDVTLNLVYNDSSGEPVPYIESTVVSGEISGRDGGEMSIPDEDE